MCVRVPLEDVGVCNVKVFASEQRWGALESTCWGMHNFLEHSWEHLSEHPDFPVQSQAHLPDISLC